MSVAPMPVVGPIRVVILGAAGRDFHDFNVVYRDNPSYEVVAFTATQIPNITDRRYPPELAGPHCVIVVMGSSPFAIRCPTATWPGKQSSALLNTPTWIGTIVHSKSGKSMSRCSRRESPSSLEWTTSESCTKRHRKLTF